MVERQMRPEVEMITTAKMTISLWPGQMFATTPKAWEIWQLEPLLRVKRIRRQRVFWVIEREEKAEPPEAVLARGRALVDMERALNVIIGEDDAETVIAN